MAKSKPWSDAERWKLQRALDLYERQIKLIFHVESWGKRTFQSVENVAKRLENKWKPKEGTKKLPLKIEEDTKSALSEIKTYKESFSSTGTKIPKCLLGEGIEANEEIVSLERKIIELQDQLSDTNRKIKLMHREEILFKSLAEVIQQEQVPLSPVPLISAITKKNATKVDGVVILTDEHADAVIRSAGTWGLEEYDFNIFRCRLTRWVNTILKFVTVHLPMHDFERLWVLKLGDSVHGDIHGKANKNYFKNTIKAALAVGDAEAQAFQTLAPFFPEGVHVIGVPGNHTRRTHKRKEYDSPHNSFDYLVMTQIATRLEKEMERGTVSVFAPEAYSAYVLIRNQVWALNHGDDVRGYAGHPWYGFSRRNNRVQALVARKGLRIKYFTYGHYHTSVEMQEADSESLHAGAWYLTDDFAINALAVGSEPVQPFYAVDDKYGKMLSIPIYVRDEDKEEAFRAGEWNPPFGNNLIIDSLEGEFESTEFQLIGG